MSGFVAIAPPAFASTPPSNTPPANCDSSFNPYSYTAAAVRSCGFAVAPLANITTLTDGVKIYNYDEGNGLVSHLPIPPAGTDLADATPQMLSELGLVQPAGMTSLQWLSELGAMRIVTPPPFQASGGSVAGSSPNWSGYANTGADGTFDGAQIDYQEPSYDNYTCTNDQTAVWAGIGGDASPTDPLGQSGTAHNATGLANHQAWYEVSPLEPQEPLSLVASAGNSMLSYTLWNGSAYTGLVDDTSTGSSIPWSQSVSSSYYSGDGAEAIIERLAQSAGGPLYNLSNFGSAGIGASYGRRGSTWTGLNSGPNRDEISMYDGSTPLALPGSIGTDGYFTDTWKNCS